MGCRCGELLVACRCLCVRARRVAEKLSLGWKCMNQEWRPWGSHPWLTEPLLQPPPSPPQAGSPRLPVKLQNDYSLARPLLGNAAKTHSQVWRRGTFSPPPSDVYTKRYKTKAIFSLHLLRLGEEGTCLFSQQKHKHPETVETLLRSSTIQKCHTDGGNTRAQHFDILKDLPLF